MAGGLVGKGSRHLILASYVYDMSAVPEAIQPVSGPSFVQGLQQRLLRQFKVQVADWLDTCRELPAWEDRHLLESPPSSRLEEHLAMIAQLERVGHWLETAASQLGSEANALGETIQLAIQDLRDSRAMWHGNVPEARKKEILRDCFNES